MNGKLLRRVFAILLTICSVFSIGIAAYSTSNNRSNSLLHVFDETVNIPEPEGTNVPDYVKWDAKLGCYVLKDFTYNKDEKKYDLKDKENPSYMESEAYRKEQWLEKNKNTKNKLYLGIFKWMEYKSNNFDFSSIRDLKKDLGFKNSILSLNYSHVKEMLDLMYKEDVWNWEMASAIESLVGINCLPEGVMLDSSESKLKKWKEEFTNKNKFTNDKVKNDKVKDNKEIIECGLLALPVIYDEFKNGNKKHLEILPELISNAELLKEDFSKYSDNDWEKWFSNNTQKIETMRIIVEYFN